MESTCIHSVLLSRSLHCNLNDFQNETLSTLFLATHPQYLTQIPLCQIISKVTKLHVSCLPCLCSASPRAMFLSLAAPQAHWPPFPSINKKSSYSSGFLSIHSPRSAVPPILSRQFLLISDISTHSP